jgi:multidrug efflux pump subunit AcrA (membrane-fusion protein)
MTSPTQSSPRSEQPERSPYDEPDSPRGSRTNVWMASLAVALVVCAGALWVLFGGDRAEPVGETPPAPGSEIAAEGLAARDLDGDGTVYQSGMHPWVVEDDPGQCPVCGMDLQPVAVAGGEVGTVEIDPVTMQNTGVRTAPVVVQSIQRELRAGGVFEASDRARKAVSLKVGGWVERLYVDAEGDRVRAGQPLLDLYSPQLVSTQEEYLLALRNRDLLGDGGRLVEAARRRLALFDISPAHVERLEATGEVQRTLTTYAPASGTVTDKRVVEGVQVQPGMTLMEIVDLSRLWLHVDVPEPDLGWVDVGSRAVVRLESQPGRQITGRVEHVYDTLDPATRTGTARLIVPNDGGRIKPGMYATATLFGTPSDAQPSVPSEAVIRTGDAAVVILALADETGRALSGQFRPQPVTLGEEAGGIVQILDGLDGGERVVTSAQFLIDSEARLAAAVGAMATSDHDHATH